MKKLVVILCSGNLTLSYPTEGAGVYSLGDKLHEQYYDWRHQRILIRPHDCDFEYDASRIVAFSPDYLVFIGHSHGLGRALPTCNSQLMTAAKKAKKSMPWFSLVVGIDAVPFPAWPPFVPGPWTWKLPGNVYNAISICTTSWDGFHMPYGHHLEAAEGAMYKVRRVTFDKTTKDYDDKMYERWIADPEQRAKHPTIDNQPETEQEIIGAVSRRLEHKIP